MYLVSMSFGKFCLYTEALNKIPFVRTLIMNPVLYLETVGDVFEKVHKTRLVSGEKGRFSLKTESLIIK